jgi:DMSO/TMAO reductase YedYZ molybdopterin-dependent catalytic subunit
LGHLLDRARPLAGASHATFHTVRDNYNESVPLSVALEPRTLLAYGVGGFTLPLAHGFPLRLVVPRLLGYKNAKYVYRIEVTDRPEEGYWVRAGYPYAGLVPARRLRPGKY